MHNLKIKICNEKNKDTSGIKFTHLSNIKNVRPKIFDT